MDLRTWYLFIQYGLREMHKIWPMYLCMKYVMVSIGVHTVSKEVTRVLVTTLVGVDA